MIFSEGLEKVNNQLSKLKLGYNLKRINYTAPDLHEITTLRLNKVYPQGKRSKPILIGINDVGLGVSQVLPIITQCCISNKELIIVEQPELHLHPAQQAELGDVFIDAALGENKNTLLIETHSEYLILRLLRRIRETNKGNLKEGLYPITPQDISVLYVKSTENGSKVIELKVTDDGDFAEDWPDGFFAERFNELP